jgi:hypothetical protein
MTKTSIHSQNQYSARTLAQIREQVTADDPLLAARLMPTGSPGTAAAQAYPSFSDVFMAAFDDDTPAAARYRLGLEYIFEGYLLHWRRSRLIEPESGEFALLAGDYMYARGLESICRLQDTGCITALADLVSFCSRVHASGADDAQILDAWAATALALALHARDREPTDDSISGERAGGPDRQQEPLALLTGAINDIPANEANGRGLIEGLLALFPAGGGAGLRLQIDEVYSGLEKLWRSTT